MHALPGAPHRARADEERLELVVGEVVEEQAHVVLALLGDALDELAALVGEDDAHDPAVILVAAALDEAALLHAVDDARGAGLAHVERLGERAHRLGTVGLEHADHVDVDERDPSAGPVAQVAHGLGRAGGGELAHELVEEGLAVRGVVLTLRRR